MIELLRPWAQRAPGHTAIVDADQSSTYGDLVGAAASVAAYLDHHGIRRFAILDHHASTVVALLAGAAMTGAEPCVYPPTEDPTALAELARHFDHTVVVTRQTELGVSLDLVDPADLLGWPAHRAVAPAGPQPLLVLTTGTSGTPKGALHEWSRLLRSSTRTTAAPDQRWLLAYGLHQFGGLQVLIHVFAAGATLVAPAPRRPPDGLAAMRRYGVTHASATPTYWRFLLAEMRADDGPVPALEQITLGGEAVPSFLLESIAGRFPDAGVTQVYGATEFGNMSVRDQRNGLPLSVLDRPDDADIQYKVVDGELWVRSRIGMLRYYGDDTRQADGWRPTGDLVSIEGDRILFRGRNSDIINVGGVKVHPLPIEQRISNLPGVKMARVYGRKSPVTGSIVAVEIIAETGADHEGLKEAVRRSCEDLVAAARPRSVRVVDEISTTGHKIVRGTVDG